MSKSNKLHATIWIIFLAILFFSSYTATNSHANHLNSLKPLPTADLFEWEQQIPFILWFIFPYMSLDFIYAYSFLRVLFEKKQDGKIGSTQKEDINRLGCSLFLTQIISTGLFYIYPMRAYFGVENNILMNFKTATNLSSIIDAAAVKCFEYLGSFDKPFNTVPSLPISISVILLWHFHNNIFRRKVSWKATAFHTWMILVMLSVFFTHQHNLLDFITGLMLGGSISSKMMK